MRPLEIKDLAINASRVYYNYLDGGRSEEIKQ
jgi:hypothetical protein